MEFRVKVDIEKPCFKIGPKERILFVGSCFADNIGKRFAEERFDTIINPYGVMYNPASILHTVNRLNDEGIEAPHIAVLTLGTNHIYILKETGEIVDNCQKRPQSMFREEALSVDDSLGFLRNAVDSLRRMRKDVKVVMTVSPIRYAKYGYHGSVLSKATLLLAADKLAAEYPDTVIYFPAYEIVNDELRDYRFYNPDMIHPSEQAIEYIWERFSEAFFSEEAKQFVKEWRPLKLALNHKPFNPDSDKYRRFMEETQIKVRRFEEKFPNRHAST